ncbi:MAG: glucose-1-phosphate cytidylyltransferase [bacterium]
MDKIKTVILCGGQGTRIRDVSEVLPKPMLPIGGMPILWHIMKIYSHYEVTDFVLCLGYKSWIIKEFFLNYQAKISDIELTLGDNKLCHFYSPHDEDKWRIILAETGEIAQTGARIWNIRQYLKDCDLFCMTYGDGVADINIRAVIKMHKKSGLLGTITGVHPAGRFGEMEAEDNIIYQFAEKPNVSTGMINGGFMVFNREVLDKYFRKGETLALEGEVLNKMVKDRQLGVYHHKGFWQCVDTPREFSYLNDLWKKGKATWKVWK